MAKEIPHPQANQPENPEQTRRPFSQLNLMDDFMFDVATEDLETCKDIIELSLNIRLKELRRKETQKPIHNLPGQRGIRLDFTATDEDDRVFDVEMQNRNVGNIPKRTRFYKALLDTPVLKSGENGFDHLHRTFVVFICCFDPFGFDKYRYTFENRCREVPELTLEDDLQTVFLNTRGKYPGEVEPSLPEFLRFVENSSEDSLDAGTDPRIRRMAAKIHGLRQSAELEHSYMKMEERDRLIREEGEKIGAHNYLLSQVRKKLAKGQSVAQIADALEESEDVILGLIGEIEHNNISE